MLVGQSASNIGVQTATYEVLNESKNPLYFEDLDITLALQLINISSNQAVSYSDIKKYITIEAYQLS